MSTKNDKTILTLKEKIDFQKEALSKVENFQPKTTCIFEFFGKNNIHTFNVEECYKWRAIFTAMQDAHETYGDGPDIMISGFSLHDWIDDICGRLTIVETKAKEKELLDMEAKLDKLLSADKKTEMELADMAKLLGL